jgi:hypothetical protein
MTDAKPMPSATTTQLVEQATQYANEHCNDRRLTAMSAEEWRWVRCFRSYLAGFLAGIGHYDLEVHPGSFESWDAFHEWEDEVRRTRDVFNAERRPGEPEFTLPDMEGEDSDRATDD